MMLKKQNVFKFAVTKNDFKWLPIGNNETIRFHLGNEIIECKIKNDKLNIRCIEGQLKISPICSNVIDIKPEKHFT